MMFHRGDRGLGTIDTVSDGIAEVLLDESVDSAIERRREQQSLCASGGSVEQPLHRREESEVGHVIGLVEHRDLDALKGQRLLLQQVFEAARTGDDDVDTLAKRCDLRLGRNAAVHRGGAKAEGAGDAVDRAVDLARQLPGGGQDQRAWTAGLTLAVVRHEADDDGKREGQRLAGPGAATAEDVATGDGIGKGCGLDGEGGVEPAVGRCGRDGFGDAEIGETEFGERGRGRVRHDVAPR